MADSVYAFSPTIPANVPQSAPVTLPMTMPVGNVDSIEIRIPPGNNFQMGFQLFCGGGLVIPYQPNQFITGDDDLIQWALTDLPESGAWALRGFNLGVFSHTLYLRFFLSLGLESQPPPAPQITILSQTPDLAPLLLS